MLLARARNQSKAITLAVVKINPALRFYEKHGFRITHEDKHKFYLRADPHTSRHHLGSVPGKRVRKLALIAKPRPASAFRCYNLCNQVWPYSDREM
jgi:ribosomal protein S18 acetylase RimI-like enzyme